MPHPTPKDGASIAPAPVPTSAGSHSASDPVRAKIRQLFEVLGPCIVRTCDGGTHVLSAEALRVIEIPLSHSRASNPGAKQHHA